VTIQREAVVDHFMARARTYDRSSSWCTDDALGELVLRMAQPDARDHVLDVACGTGLVSKLFAGRVARLVGIDITAEMAKQAEPHLDELIIAPAEALPFDQDTFDIVTCRQGIQFMTLPDAVAEMVRVTKPGGCVVLVNLCAYGEDDREEYFQALRLRNPVRRHFFLPDEVGALLTAAGCTHVAVERYVSVEDVDVWSDNGAITEDNREAIRQVYRNASPAFRRLHAVRLAEGRIVDHMLFVVAAGRKPGVATGSRNG
jgi:SAM-dependent methyltransferase